MQNEDKLLDYLKQVTAKLRSTRARLREVSEREREPIAIIGMGCRYPGGVRDPQSMWSLLSSGGDAISAFPADRGWDDLYDPDPDAAGTTYVAQGGFLHGVADFDPSFFSISPREALAMDPQQRLLLEIAWETVESARIDPESLRGSATGVFAGAAPSGYLGASSATAGTEAHLITGNVTSVISGRVSYTLGLEGPAVTLDTACSSSLVALHLAAQALRAQECTLALAGGVTVIADPAEFVGFSRQRVLAADGRCKAFAAGADGMGIAEGAGLVLLERLSDARRNGHAVLAVIVGGAVNSDGASNGLSAPNGPSQQRVIRAALATARLSTGDVDVVEAHGTGTDLGDPIEAQALLATYGQGRSEQRPLLLGSVKSNIGHSQQAAGIAGVIKMVQALRHEQLPATLHAGEPTSLVDWTAGNVRLLQDSVPWPAGDRPRRAGVSAFGISGTNAHVILEEAPSVEVAVESDDTEVPEPPVKVAPVVPLVESEVCVWPVSGRSGAGLAGQAGRLRERVVAEPGVECGRVGWSLASTRAVFERRAVVVGSGQELASGLASVATGQPAANVVTGTATRAGRSVFVFPGQGSQWLGMGRELMQSCPVFAARLAECGAALAPWVDWSLAEVLRSGSVDLASAGVVQPVLWAVMVSLAAVWEAAGVVPAAVVGHSQGEIAAAVVAGVLSLDDGARVVALRSKALEALAGRGGMVSVAAPVDAVRELIGDTEVSIAAVNGPVSTIVSGSPQALETLIAQAEKAEIRTRTIAVDYASHSVQVEELQHEIVSVLQGIRPQRAALMMVSSRTGQPVQGPELDAAYWYASLRETVRFCDAIGTLAAEGYQSFVECSPHPVLTGAITDTITENEDTTEAPVVVGTLRRDDGGPRRLLTSLAEAWTTGLTVNWQAILPKTDTVDLPTYAFQRQRYWPEIAQWEAPVAADDARFWATVENGDAAELADLLGSDGAGLDDALPALASWRRRSRQDCAVTDWRYRTTWVPVAEPGETALSGTWLVVARDAASDCADALRVAGADVRLLQTAATGRLELAAAIPAGPYVGVVSLLALDDTPLPEHPVVPSGIAATLALVQALGDLGIDAPLWALSRGAVAAVAGEAPVPAQAQVWGLAQVIGLELPERWGGLIDLPAQWDDRTGARLTGVLVGCGEDQVAIRPPGLLARRLIRARPPQPGREPFTPRDTVLITGGTGLIGSRLGGWMADRGAARLVLTSRSGPAASGAPVLAAELAGRGCGVDVLACDIGDRDQVAGLLRRIDSTGPRLSAVAHAAGVARASFVTDTTIDELADVAAAKVGGAHHLDELAGDLDAFVLFSSGAATWGSGLLGGYAAANAALDAIAAARLARGHAATSVAWGLWGGGGMGAGDAGDQLRRYGLRVMDPDDGITALGQALDNGDGLLAVADIDWAQFAPTFTMRRPSPLLSTLPDAVQALSGATEDAPADGEFGGRLGALTLSDRAAAVTEFVRAEAAAVLGYDNPLDVDADRAFRDLGFDSVTAVELRNRLATATGVPLPSTVVFDYPSASTLAGFVLGELFGSVPTESTGTGPAANTDSDPIVIVGMGCRFPGGVASPEALWDVLATGTDAIAPFPKDRGWDIRGLYGQEGGFVETAADFDAGFFGISPREALAMDPQQRLLLEVSWEALERAGIDPLSLKGSRTGVFAGGWLQVWGNVLAQSSMDGYTPASDGGSVLSGRISYTLGLEGPALTIDTACSSSLVALHLAAQALRSGECTLALAGGVTVMPTPGAFGFGAALALAENGRCKPFSADADGMGMGEGAAMLAVERLSDARRNGHPVLAIVRGTAVNSDGASNGLTAPNGPSQQRVIRAALADAGLGTADVDAVEAHGTGTVLGDPIEAGALIATYGRDRDRPVWLGSIKSNLGHTQAAAGVAGIMKMVLGMQHETLPQTLNAEQRSPHIEWDAGRVQLLVDPVAWPVGSRPRRAGISGFGISGTNAHVVIEEPPPVGVPEPDRAAPLAPGAYAWPISARTAPGLADQAGRLREFVLTGGRQDEADTAWSLATTRSTFTHRAVVVGDNRAQLLDSLAAVATGQPESHAVVGAVPPRGPGKTVFVFPGQGSQWPGMGRELYASSPVFARRFDECAAALVDFVEWSPVAVLTGADGAPEPDTAAVLQPLLWALMVSLASMWEAAGVTPDAVLGHSQGEIAAATVAGILTLSDAARVVAVRSKALADLDVEGGMLSAVLAADEVLELIGPWGERLSVAAVNSPVATVVSGEPQALTEFERELRARRVMRWRIPQTDFVAHSALCEPVADVLARGLRNLRPADGRIPFFSTVQNRWLAGTELDAGYWFANVRQTVRFADGVSTLAAEGHRSFIEVSTHPVCLTAVEEVFDARDDLTDPVLAGTLRREDGGAARLLASFAQAHVQGVPVDWAAVLGGGRPVELPTYAFAHQRYWPAPNGSGAAGAEDLGLDPIGHPLIGAAFERADGDGLICTGRISLRTHPWLADHVIRGMVILPGAAFAELAFVVAAHAGCGTVEDLVLEVPLTVPAEGTVRLQVEIGAFDADGRREFTVYARTGTDAPWSRYASGVLARDAEPSAASADLAVWPPAGAEPVDVTGFYDLTAHGGYALGPAFRGLRAVWQRGTDVFADVRLPDHISSDADVFGIHPALLDAAQQAGIFATGAWETGETWLSFGWSGMTLHAGSARSVRVRLRRDAHGGLSLLAADATGAPVLTLDAIVMRRAASVEVPAADSAAEALFGLDWVPVRAARRAPSGPWVVVGTGDLADELAAGLTGIDVRRFTSLQDLGDLEPEAVLLAVAPSDGSPAQVRERTGDALVALQHWLTEPDLEPARLVLVTRGAVAALPGENVADAGGATVWGLVRSAQSENPDRLVLADLANAASVDALVTALGSEETELAVRGSDVHTRRLVRPAGGIDLPVGPWLLQGRTPRECEIREPGVGEVLVAVRAAVFSDAVFDGSNGFAGVVARVGAGVTGLSTGDRVHGVTDPNCASYLTVPADVLRVLDGGSYVEAAAGATGPLPVLDIRRVGAATGPVVLTLPVQPRPGGTVLVTGGTGNLGGVVAGHLADIGRAADVVLTSRSGPGASGVADLAAGLAGRGVSVGVTTCDAADADALAAVLKRLPALTGVVHAAGVLDDGVIGSLTAERVHNVLRPKADAAFYLHRLTRHRDLDLFVLFSSAAATLGAPGQSNYAAANSYLDALAVQRRAVGLPAVSLTWGLWADSSGMAKGLDAGDRAKFSRTGIGSIEVDQGLALLDLALSRDEAVLAPMPLDLPTLRAIARAGGRLPSVLHGLAPAPKRAREVSADGARAALREQLVGASESERHALLLKLVRVQAAAVLGHGAPEAVEVDATFLEQGMDSLTAVEFRNRLAMVSGLRLTGALAFDHPTPTALADRLVSLLTEQSTDRAVRTDGAVPTAAPVTPDSLTALYLRAHAAGDGAAVMRHIQGLSRFRETFAQPAAADVPAVVSVSRGPADLSLVCLPSFAGTADAREFARFGRGFAGTRAVSALPVPGCAGDGPLAQDPAALLRAYAAALARQARPFALAGYSSGGLVAQALAGQLRQKPAALVLIDTFTPLDAGVPDEVLAALPAAVLAGADDVEGTGGDGWLTSMAHYYGFDWRELPVLDIPTLVVRAADSPESPWHFSSAVTTVTVPGDHFTMMRKHAATTAGAVHGWLAEQRVPTQQRRPNR